MPNLVPFTPASLTRQRHLTVVAEGGAMCSDGEKSGHVPRQGVIEELMDKIPEKVRGAFSDISVDFPSDRLVLSSQLESSRATVQRLVQFLARVRKALEKGSVIAPVGSWKMAHYAAAVMLGVSPSDLLLKQDDVASSVLLVSSLETWEESDLAQRILEAAFQVVGHPGMSNSAGAMFSPDTVHVLPGLLRQNDHSLVSRFKPMAWRNQDSLRWMFSAPPNGEHIPIGNGGELILNPNIRSLSYNDNEAGAKDATQSLADFRENPAVEGLVIRTQHRSDPFTSICRDYLRQLDALGMPVVLVNDITDLPESPTSSHAESYRHLVDGRRAMGPEAVLILSEALGNTGSVTDIVRHVRNKFENYPFR